MARYECQLRLRDAAPSAQLYEAAQALDDTGTFAAVTEPVAFAEQAAYHALVRAVLAGLDPVNREISELILLHEFYGADLAAILGAPRNQAHVLAKRSRLRLERSLGVLLVARADREHCHKLAAILDRRGGKAILPLRWRVNRHIGRCKVCGDGKRSGLNAGILASLFPVVPPPSYLRERILDLVSDDSPTAVAYRARVADRAPRFDADGFPVQLTTPSTPGSRLTPVSVAAAAAALALLGGAMYYVNNSSRVVGNLAVVGGPPRLFGPTGSSGSTRPPASPPQQRLRPRLRPISFRPRPDRLDPCLRSSLRFRIPRRRPGCRRRLHLHLRARLRLRARLHLRARLPRRRRRRHAAVDPAVDPAVHAAVDPAVHAAVDPAVHAAVDPAVHAAVDPAVHAAVDPAVHAAVDPAVHAAVDPAVHAAVDPAVDPAVHAAVLLCYVVRYILGPRDGGCATNSEAIGTDEYQIARGARSAVRRGASVLALSRRPRIPGSGSSPVGIRVSQTQEPTSG